MATFIQPIRNDMVSALCAKYALGHAEIDAQHRRIFEIIVQDDNGMPVQQVLKELYTYAADHFTAEERIADDNHVEDEEHIAAHKALLDRISIYRVAPGQSSAQIRAFLVE